MKILADSTLPGLTDVFGADFELTLYHSPEELPDLMQGQEVLLCRSTLKVNATLLKGTTFKYIATASSGTDHIDNDYLQKNHMQLIDAKGCNAHSVADYVQSCLAYLNQQQLIQGNKLGIIGLGEVGGEVYRRLKTSTFDVIGFDPFKGQCHQEALYDCDVLCIHAALHHNTPHPSFDLINEAFLAKLKPGCVLINAARGGIVNEEALLNHKAPLIYCTDVYLNEPTIDKRIIEKATLCTPHIAGHSIEAKFAAVAMIGDQLKKILGLAERNCLKPRLSDALNYQNNDAWQKKVLSLYNPIEETHAFKKAQDKKSAFLDLRKKHHKRHDFWVYFETL